MTRLDSVIRRLLAQRSCLDWAAVEVAGREGLVFELGLGNGRTFDHLRDRLPGREVYVFDRQVAAHPDCIPDSDHMLIGDIRETLPAAVARFPGRCVLVHCDIGTGLVEENRKIAEFLAKTLPAALARDALVISDQRIELPDSEPLPLPEGVPQGRYFVRRYHG